MSKPSKSKLFEWRITRIRSTPAALVGYVEAPDDPEQAIREAIAKFEISSPVEQARLAAQRVRKLDK